MARGRGSNRGSNRGGYRGNGRGNGRGGFRGRGRGRGDSVDDFDDFSIYDWANNAPRGTPNGSNAPKYRGRGRGSGYSTPRGGTPRGGFTTPNRGFDGPHGRGRPRYNTFIDNEDPDPGMGRGRGSPRGRGRGRGGKNLSSKLKAGAPLSKLLYEDRPLLRPIIFVRSVYTATLFEEEEDILKPLAEDTTNDEESHVPTASRINRVFGMADDDAPEEEQLEEIDFSEIGRLQAEVDAAAAKLAEAKAEATSEVTVVEEKFTGFYIDTNPAPVMDASPRRDTRETLGDDDDDDDVIVYVAPHPRAGPITPPAETSAAEILPTASILTGRVPQASVAGAWAASTTETLAAPAAEDPVVDVVMEELAAEAPQPEDRGSVPEGRFITALSPAAKLIALDEKLAEEAVAPSIEVPSGRETAAVTEAIGVLSAPAAGQPEIIAGPTPAATFEPAEPAAPSSAEAGLSTQPAPTGDFAFTFTKTTQKKTYTRRLHPARTPRSLVKKGAKARRKPLCGFNSFGASLAEAQLRREDPRASERRVGDSDLDWGDASGADPVDELSNGIGDMAVDGELDINAMARFAESMSAEGSRTVTMDDIADAQRMREEDEEEGEGSGAEESDEEDSELEEVVRKEEELMVAEGIEIAVEGDEGEDDEDDEEEDSDDDFDSPDRGFQARLQRIREHAAEGKGKAKAVQPPDNDDDDDDDSSEMALEQSWADKDEDFIAHIQKLNDESQEILTSKDRKLQNSLFRSIRNGDINYDEYEKLVGGPATRKKDQYKGLPKELQAQWEQDRAKKAENKRKRERARLEAASDPLVQKKGGKKGMKATLAAARYEGEDELPNRIVDFASLEQQIRRFLANIDGPRTMTTPPANKESREKIHKLANAFNLKSQSKGEGSRRYTTLAKTTKSGINVNEKKVRRILRSSGYWDTTGSVGGGKGGTVSLAKHREGEEVGKAAPKISESNIGFRMLASMGWADGDRIGLSGGLVAPLTAKMKKTKLGLGATPLS